MSKVSDMDEIARLTKILAIRDELQAINDELLPEVIENLSNPDAEPINVRQGIRSINSAMDHVYKLAEELPDES